MIKSQFLQIAYESIIWIRATNRKIMDCYADNQIKDLPHTIGVKRLVIEI